ncbi:gustatory receptor for sugar taste 64a-like [Haliotis asinina]|uniref:gustatory receptor for sugar taste 64a-like n=1 Tax=Haliotis asinina TaxID=109174 RepID=UPI003531D622
MFMVSPAATDGSYSDTDDVEDTLTSCSCVATGVILSTMGDTSSDWFWPSLVLSSVTGGVASLLNHSLLLLFLSISLILTYEYDSCTLRLSRASEGTIKEEDIEDIRGYHASLTDLVEHVCSLMSKHVAAGYVSSFLIVCFCLYSLINDEKSIAGMSAAASAVYISTLDLIAFTYIGVRLHEAAHRPLNVLLDMNLENMSDRGIGLVTLFANKLSQRQIGISALGLMTITKDTILTIIGTLLTYVFIVIQFKPDSSVGIQHNGNATTA